MPCFVILLAFLAPRLAIVVLVVIGDDLGRAYESTVWPVLGFVFAPLTTLAYAWSINTRGAVTGLGLLIVVLAVLADMGLIGTTRKRE
jgi:hypothetical protein